MQRGVDVRTNIVESKHPLKYQQLSVKRRSSSNLASAKGVRHGVDG